MNPNLLSFYPKFLLDEKTGTSKTPKAQVFDTTVYPATVDDANVDGCIIQAKRENVQFYANTNFDAPDVTISPATNAKIALPVDADDNTLHGEYYFKYKSRILNEVILEDQLAESPGASPFTTINVDGALTHGDISSINSLISQTAVTIAFLDINGNQIATSALASIASVGPDTVLTFASTTTASYASIKKFRFITYYEKEVTVTYMPETNADGSCNADPEWPTPVLEVTGDCIKAQISAQDKTTYVATDTLTSRTIYFNYPVLADGTPVHAQETTTASGILVGPSVWLGSYTIALVSVITRTQADTLVLQQTIKAYNYFNLQCDRSLCCMADCIATVFANYKAALDNNLAQKLPVLTGNMIVIGYWRDQHTTYLECGETDQALACLAELKTYLESIGCSCDCEPCGNNGEPVEIFPLFSDPYPTYVPLTYLEGDNITVNSNTRVPTNKAVVTYIGNSLGNYYTKAQADAAFGSNFDPADYYDKTDSDARFILKFDKTHQVSGNSPVTLNQLSGRVTIAYASPVAPGEVVTLRINSVYAKKHGFVIVQIMDQGVADGFQLLSVVSGNGYFTFNIKNISAGNIDDTITIQYLICND